MTGALDDWYRLYEIGKAQEGDKSVPALQLATGLLLLASAASRKSDKLLASWRAFAAEGVYSAGGEGGATMDQDNPRLTRAGFASFLQSVLLALACWGTVRGMGRQGSAHELTHATAQYLASQLYGQGQDDCAFTTFASWYNAAGNEPAGFLELLDMRKWKMTASPSSGQGQVLISPAQVAESSAAGAAAVPQPAVGRNASPRVHGSPKAPTQPAATPSDPVRLSFDLAAGAHLEEGGIGAALVVLESDVQYMQRVGEMSGLAQYSPSELVQQLLSAAGPCVSPSSSVTRDQYRHILRQVLRPSKDGQGKPDDASRAMLTKAFMTLFYMLEMSSGTSNGSEGLMMFRRSSLLPEK